MYIIFRNRGATAIASGGGRAVAGELERTAPSPFGGDFAWRRTFIQGDDGDDDPEELLAQEIFHSGAFGECDIVPDECATPDDCATPSSSRGAVEEDGGDNWPLTPTKRRISILATRRIIGHAAPVGDEDEILGVI